MTGVDWGAGGWGSREDWIGALVLGLGLIVCWRLLRTPPDGLGEQGERLARAPRGTPCARRRRWWHLAALALLWPGMARADKACADNCAAKAEERREPPPPPPPKKKPAPRPRSGPASLPWAFLLLALLLPVSGCSPAEWGAGGLLLGLLAGGPLTRGWRRLRSIWRDLRDESDTDRGAAWLARHPDRRTCGYEPWGSERQPCGAPATCIGEWAGSDWMLSCDKHCYHRPGDGRCYPIASVRPRSWWRVLRDALAVSPVLSLTGCSTAATVGWAVGAGLAGVAVGLRLAPLLLLLLCAPVWGREGEAHRLATVGPDRAPDLSEGANAGGGTRSERAWAGTLRRLPQYRPGADGPPDQPEPVDGPAPNAGGGSNAAPNSPLRVAPDIGADPRPTLREQAALLADPGSDTARAAWLLRGSWWWAWACGVALVVPALWRYQKARQAARRRS